MNRRLVYSYLYLLLVQLIVLLFMSAVRIAFAWINFPAAAVFSWPLMLQALLKGVQFDLQVASYTALPALLPLTVLSYVNTVNIKAVLRFVNGYYAVLYTLVFCVLVADIHYFQFFDNHLNWQALEWFRFAGTTVGMLVEDVGNYVYLLGGLLLSALFWSVLRRLRRALDRIDVSRPLKPRFGELVLSVMLSLSACGLNVLGMRASLERYPLTVSFASFCNQPYYNRIPVNCWVNILETYTQSQREQEVALLDRADAGEALDYVLGSLGLTAVTDSLHPLSRPVSARDTLSPPNVVVILMESMSSQLLDERRQGRELTPYLNQLRHNSLYFSNFYSAGIHTNNGIVASLYGYSPNFAQAAMRTPSDLFTGLPYTLREQGYQTMAFVTSNPNFDNMQAFFYDNAIERLYSIYDYPASERVNNYGVPDAFLFSYGLQTLARRQEADRPFFALFLTVSNHPPYCYPEEFSSRAGTARDCTVAYADDCIGSFLESAMQTEWGRHTIFVLCGDHGWVHGDKPFDMALQYNHVPAFLLGAPIRGHYGIYDAPAGQIDLFATVMSLTGLPYVNNTLGVDLLATRRRYIHFVSNDHLGCTDGEWFWCYNLDNGREYLYRIHSADQRDGKTGESAANLSDQEAERAAEMRQYAVNMMKINNMAINQKWTNPH